jgi:type II secretory pathway component PulM
VSQGDYVVLAYGAVLVVVLIWVAIIAAKLVRLERETGELAELTRGRRRDG